MILKKLVINKLMMIKKLIYFVLINFEKKMSIFTELLQQNCEQKLAKMSDCNVLFSNFKIIFCRFLKKLSFFNLDLWNISSIIAIFKMPRVMSENHFQKVAPIKMCQRTVDVSPKCYIITRA